jgi:hypothetical protein
MVLLPVVGLGEPQTGQTRGASSALIVEGVSTGYATLMFSARGPFGP